MRRSALLVVLMLAGAGTSIALPTIDELLSLRGQALFDAASLYQALDGFSTQDLIRLFKLIETEKKNVPKHDFDSVAAVQVFEEACRKSNDREVDQLIEIYTKLDPEDVDKELNFEPIAARCLKREIEHRDYSGIVLQSDEQSSVPPQLKAASAELLDAWKQYKGAVKPFEARAKSIPNRNQISFQANRRAFFQLIDNVLLKRGDHLADQLAQFGWSGSSGTGSESLGEPRSIGTFMVLLTENRTAEALGAALEMTSSRPIASGKTDVRVEFLRRAGVDWEAILAGAELDCELDGFFGTYEHPYLTELARHGSDRAAHLLSLMARRSSPDIQRSYANAMSAFFPPLPGNEEHFLNGVDERSERTRISNAVQMELLAALQQLADSNPSAEVASATLDGFARAKFAGTKPTLYALMKHPSRRVAAEAAEVLQSMGENVQPPEQKPARFQILANKKPLAAGTRVAWQVNSTSSSTDVLPDGIVSLDREPFTNTPGEPANVTFANDHRSGLTDPIFLVQLHGVTNLDSLTPVNVELSKVELLIHKIPRGKTEEAAVAHVTIRRSHANSEEFGDYDPYKAKLDVPVDTPINLLIQNGEYVVEIDSPGSAHLTKEVAVSDKTSSVDMQLSPGTDLHYQIVRPDGEHRAPFGLFRGSEDVGKAYFDRETEAFRGLPPGEYVLRIPGSDKVKDGGDFLGYAPAQISYGARDVYFTITPDSPSVIDLGTITLAPAGPSR